MTLRLSRAGLFVPIMAASLLATPRGARAQAKPAAPEEATAALVRRAGMSRARGVKDASVTVYEVADFECPFCAQFANQTFPRIDSAYVKPGKVQWVYVNLPLVIHANAFQAAEAALCAGAVGDRFWAMHEKLYASQAEWKDAADPQAVFLRYARELSVPASAYGSCIRADRVWSVIMRDAMYAASAQIDGTPTYIIGNQVAAVGSKSFDEWKTILDKAIQDAASKKKP